MSGLIAHETAAMVPICVKPLIKRSINEALGIFDNMLSNWKEYSSKEFNDEFKKACSNLSLIETYAPHKSFNIGLVVFVKQWNNMSPIDKCRNMQNLKYLLNKYNIVMDKNDDECYKIITLINKELLSTNHTTGYYSQKIEE